MQPCKGSLVAHSISISYDNLTPKKDTPKAVKKLIKEHFDYFFTYISS
ncbi:hypothetical protein MNB_SM-7-843 [hydrothermal vent metagenome]|uniref:Uncharacterized protein n=1 Tax=hydrothermal vent metagenome TaxID=652676 RepID=A0A1W1BQQ1_9ZZZZ